MSEQIAVTAEELRQRAEEIRQRRKTDKPAVTGLKAVEASRVGERSARCPCGVTWVYQVVERMQGDAVVSRVPNLPDVSPCRDCQKKVAEEQQREEEAEEASRRRERRIANEAQLLDDLNTAGVNPWEHRDSTFATFDAHECGAVPPEAAEAFVIATLAARKYEPVRGLYLCGDTGAGKTHLAVATVRALLEYDYKGRIIFDHALGLILRIQDTYSTGESAEKLIDRRVNAAVWVLDDLGTEKPSDDVVRRLTTIFAERGPRPTLVTSNLTPDQLTDPKRNPQFFRLASRLGPKMFRTVRVKGHDRRFDA